LQTGDSLQLTLEYGVLYFCTLNGVKVAKLSKKVSHDWQMRLGTVQGINVIVSMQRRCVSDTWEVALVEVRKGHSDNVYS